MLNCHGGDEECLGCAKRMACVYTNVFKPNLIRGNLTVERGREHAGTIPAAYAIGLEHYDMSAVSHYYQRGEMFGVNLALFGDYAVRQAALLVAAMIEGLSGFFVEAGFLEVLEVADGFDDAGSVYSPGSQIVSPEPLLWSDRAGEDLLGHAVLEFDAPLALDRAEGKQSISILDPDLELVVTRVVLRAQSMVNLFTEGEFVFPQEVVEAAKLVEVRSSFMVAAGVKRSMKDPNAAVVGRMELSGDLRLLAPYLYLGSVLHIGKSVTMGYGGYRLVFG